MSQACSVFERLRIELRDIVLPPGGPGHPPNGARAPEQEAVIPEFIANPIIKFNPNHNNPLYHNQNHNNQPILISIS